MPPVGAKTGKAYLLIKEAGENGGKEKIAEIQFQYNPKEFSIDKSSSWKPQKSKKPKKAPPSEFTGADPRSLSVEVFLDYTDHEKPDDIMKDIQALFAACGPTPKSIQQNHPTPPYVTFGWGKNVEFEAFLNSVNVKFTLFSPEGQPLRASASLKMTEVMKEAAGQNPTSGALAAMRTHTVVEGDSLASIAYGEYGDAALWRAVAEANGIDDPMRLRAGASLLLPDIEEASAYR